MAIENFVIPERHPDRAVEIDNGVEKRKRQIEEEEEEAKRKRKQNQNQQDDDVVEEEMISTTGRVRQDDFFPKR